MASKQLKAALCVGKWNSANLDACVGTSAAVGKGVRGNQGCATR